MNAPYPAESPAESVRDAESCRPCDAAPPSADATELDALRQIVDRAEMALVVYTVSGTCVFATEALAKMMGTSLERWRHSSLWEVTAWKTAGVVHDAVLTLADGEARTRGFVTSEKALAVATVYRLHNGPHDLVALVVAPARCSDERLGERQMENLVNLAAATARRVNAGLVPATCALELLSQETSDSKVSSMLILQAQDAIRRVASSVSRVLDVMAEDVRSSTVFDFTDVIEELRRSRSWEERARLFIDLQAVRGLPRARGSAERIRASLENVLDHALASSEAGGVRVDATCVDIEHPFYVSSGDALEPGAYAVFSIADDGPGQEEVGNPAPYSTTRLGRRLELSSAAKSVRDHGGGIDVESGPSGCTTIRVWIAVLRDDAL